MKGWILSIGLLIWGSGLLPAQSTFSKMFGGKGDEHALSVIQTRDGDYVLVGFTFSFGAGKSDIWVMKTDPYGEVVWQKFFGDAEFEWANDLIETRDGNYVVAGYQKNTETDISNAWVFQLNRHGELMWSEVFGGEQSDEARSIVQTSDGGYAIAGFSKSFAKGESDIWMLRLNAVGQEMWQKSFGGKGTEQAYSIVETRDEGFLLGGFQQYREHLKADMLLVKVDRNGKGVWRRAINTKGNDVIESVIENPDGTFMAAGWGFSKANNSLDARILKVSAGGKVLWDRSYGGKGKDTVYELIRTADGGYAAAGQTGSHGSRSDVWLLKLDPNGLSEWQQRSQGESDDWGHSLCATFDGGYALAGGTKSFAQEGNDMILMKTDARGNFGIGVETTRIEQVSTASPLNLPANLYRPNLYVLAVGVSNFQDESVKLTFAHSDAAAVADEFASMEGKLFKQVKVKKLLNEEANLTNIKQGISWLEKEATQKDMVLVYISSHGALDHKGNLYILPNDFHPYNLFATALNIRDLTDGMSGAPCKKLIFLDACHSGQSGFDLMEMVGIKALNLNQAVGDMVRSTAGVTVMTSSSGNEFSYENTRWGHGAFSKGILEGLNGAADFNGDRIISLLELNLYVTERVKELTDGRQHPFTPINLFGDVPLFLLE